MQKDWFAIFKVRITARARMIKIWQCLLYQLNRWSFCHKLGLMVHYHKPECLMEKGDCCGQGHSNILKCQWMFVQVIFSESLNLLLPNLVWWCIIISQIVFQKGWCIVFKIKATVTDYVIKMWLSIFWTADPFMTKLGFMAHHHKLDCLVKRLDCSVVVKVKVAEKVKNSSECSSGRYLLSCWLFCNQTWYGDARAWANVSCKKIGLLSSSSRWQLRII